MTEIASVVVLIIIGIALRFLLKRRQAARAAAERPS